MGNVSFGAKTPNERLLELIEEYDEFCNDRLNEWKANNICTNLWQLSDWIFNNGCTSFASVCDFRKDLFSKCSDLKVLHDIANASKHFSLTRPKADIKEARKHRGSFNSSFSFAFDISSLDLELDDGTIIHAENMIKKTLDFWKQYFKDELGIII